MSSGGQGPGAPPLPGEREPGSLPLPGEPWSRAASPGERGPDAVPPGESRRGTVSSGEREPGTVSSGGQGPGAPPLPGEREPGSLPSPGEPWSRAVPPGEPRTGTAASRSPGVGAGSSGDEWPGGTSKPADRPASGGEAPPPPLQPPPPSPPSPSPASQAPPRSAGRRGGPRGLTTSGTGAADLTEPDAVGPPPRTVFDLPPLPPPFLPSQPGHVGSGPPTYDAEPTALPPADPDGLDGLVPDTVLDGARYGTCTLRAVSVRGDSARYRGEPRRDALLVARFGAGDQALVLVAMATGVRATPGAHRAAAEVCRWIGRAVGRSHARLAEDLRAARRGELKSGLHRLTDRSLGRLRAGAAEQGLAPDEYAASLRCLLLPADPGCRTRVFFGVGAGGLLRLRDGAWRNMEPSVGDVTGEPVLGFGSAPRRPPGGTPPDVNDAPSETPDGDRLTMDLGITAAPGPHDGPPVQPQREPFRFRASVARPGDVLLMCTTGLAEPLLSEPELGELLARRWADRTPPGLGEFLGDSGVRVKGYADDRTAAAVWEA
ncbi:protein phosphatase 2C domain-containing protein [Streptomyces sp. NPDC006349]|uniref:protein phosphatase 2C domain-containing protein n=1 Tax=Streptomyces sp. NPDC006349 TaxID=3156757 RepID=UPI0033B2E1B3